MNATITTSDLKWLGKDAQGILLNWLNDNGILPTEVCEVTVYPDEKRIETIEYKRNAEGNRYVLADHTVAQTWKKYDLVTYSEEVQALFARIPEEVLESSDS